VDRHNGVGVSGEEIRPCCAKALRTCSTSIASCPLYVEKMNFVIEGKAPIAIEAKWNADAFDPDGLQACSEYLSGANIQSSMPDIVDILWFEMKDTSPLAGTKAVFSCRSLFLS